MFFKKYFQMTVGQKAQRRSISKKRLEAALSFLRFLNILKPHNPPKIKQRKKRENICKR